MSKENVMIELRQEQDKIISEMSKLQSAQRRGEMTENIIRDTEEKNKNNQESEYAEVKKRKRKQYYDFMF